MKGGIKISTKLNNDASYQVIPSFDSDRFIKLRMRLLCDGPTRHVKPRYYFTKTSIEAARFGIANIPILASTLFDEDGNPVFGSHDMHLEVDNDDNLRLIHDEKILGVIPETCSYAMEEHDGKNYVCVDGYVWKKYADYGLDVLLAHAEVPLSIEVDVVDAVYDEESDICTVERFVYNGVTLLGDDVTPAVPGAKADITLASNEADFDAMCTELNELLNSKDSPNKGVKTVDKDKKTSVEEGSEEVTESETKTEETQESKTKETEEPKTEDETEVIEETDTEADDKDAQAGLEETQEDNSTTGVECALSSLIEQGLNSALASLGVSKENGADYFLCDYDLERNAVYFSDWYTGEIFKCGFSITGDTVAIDGNLTRQVVCYRDALEPATTNFATDTLKEIVTSAREAKELSAKVEVLNAKVTEMETERKVAEINAAATQFTDLADVEEFKTLLNSAAEIADVETFTEKCYALRGKQAKPEQLMASATQPKGLRVPLPLNNNAQPSDLLSRMVATYKNK